MVLLTRKRKMVKLDPLVVVATHSLTWDGENAANKEGDADQEYFQSLLMKLSVADIGKMVAIVWEENLRYNIMLHYLNIYYTI